MLQSHSRPTHATVDDELFSMYHCQSFLKLSDSRPLHRCLNLAASRANDCMYCFTVSLCNLCDASAVLYVNRATCYVRLHQWDQVEQECKEALSKEPAHMQVNIASHAYRHSCSIAVY